MLIQKGGEGACELAGHRRSLRHSDAVINAS